MRKLLLLIVLGLPLHAATKVTLLHFSDYHSHALPFFTDDGPDRGGLARAIGYLKREKRRGALVFSGGDMINKGSPAWSDKYGCAEWPWLNRIVDAMAFGNHDADYGREAFEKCRASLRYPILSANTPGMQRYAVVKTKGIRIGVFAVAGSDFPALVKGMTFTDATTSAREVVRELREKERVDAIVMIGHEHAEEDFALARAVPGIDVIFGSHSHRKQDATVISGTNTLFLSPFQYLTYIGRVELTFDRKRLTKAAGQLVPVHAKLAEDRAVAKKVRAMQHELERDPQYRELFSVAGTLAAPLNSESLAHGVLTTMREVAKADVAMSTASSFRQPLPAGPITHELLRAALPYDNEIFVAELTGVQVRKVLDYSDTKAGSDSVMFIVGGARLDPQKTYRVATTDYAAKVAAGYRDLFPGAKGTGLRARAEFARRMSSSAAHEHHHQD